VTVEDEDSDAEIVATTEQSPDDLDLLATGTYPIEVSDEKSQAIADDEANDVGDLEIQDREFNEEINVWTTSNNAFEDVEDADEPSDALAGAVENGTVQQQSEVANGDVVVHEIQATGLEGLVEAGIQTERRSLQRRRRLPRHAECGTDRRSRPAHPPDERHHGAELAAEGRELQ